MATRDEFELFWQAYLYLGDEMPPAEAEAFEAQLALDQSAREALAKVVDLSQAVAAQPISVLTAGALTAGTLEPLAVASNPWRWRAAVGWACTGAAACLAIVLTLESLRSGPAGTNPALENGRLANVPVTNHHASIDMALAWAEAHAAESSENGVTKPAGESIGLDGVELANHDHAAGATQPTASPGFDDLAMPSVQNDADSTAPDWLLAAVEIAHGAEAPQEN
jgi:hypothetical protein